MSEENFTTPTVPGDGSSASPAQEGGAEAISLAELKEALGKDFKDTASAIKSVKDTFSYVGAQAQYRERMQNLTARLGTDEAGVIAALETLAGAAKPTPPEGSYVPREQYEADQFFSTRKDLSDLRPVLSQLKQANPDVSWSDFVKQPHISQVVERYTGYEELSGKKSVLESNSRIAAMTDSRTKAVSAIDAARAASRQGDVGRAEAAYEAAANEAVIGLLKRLS